MIAGGEATSCQSCGVSVLAPQTLGDGHGVTAGALETAVLQRHARDLRARRV